MARMTTQLIEAVVEYNNKMYANKAIRVPDVIITDLPRIIEHYSRWYNVLDTFYRDKIHKEGDSCTVYPAMRYSQNIIGYTLVNPINWTDQNLKILKQIYQSGDYDYHYSTITRFRNTLEDFIQRCQQAVIKTIRSSIKFNGFIESLKQSKFINSDINVFDEIGIRGFNINIVIPPYVYKHNDSTNRFIGAVKYSIEFTKSLEYSGLYAHRQSGFRINPHIEAGHGGIPCLGGFAYPFHECIEAGDIEGAVLTLLDYNKTIDENDGWGRNISTFLVVDGMIGENNTKSDEAYLFYHSDDVENDEVPEYERAGYRSNITQMCKQYDIHIASLRGAGFAFGYKAYDNKVFLPDKVTGEPINRSKIAESDLVELKFYTNKRNISHLLYLIEVNDDLVTGLFNIEELEKLKEQTTEERLNNNIGDFLRTYHREATATPEVYYVDDTEQPEIIINEQERQTTRAARPATPPPAPTVFQRQNQADRAREELLQRFRDTVERRVR